MEKIALPSSSRTNALTTGSVLALIASMLLVGTSFGAIAPLVSAILEDRGFSEYFTGGVTAILALAIAVYSPYVGKLVERHGTRRINSIGLVGQAVGFAGLGVALATYEVLLFPIRFAIGAAATMTFVAAEVALLRGVAAKIRGRVMAAYGSALAVGFMLGVFASDLAYDWIGLWCFGLVAATAVVITPLAWRGMRGEVGDPFAPRQTAPTTIATASYARLEWRPLILGLFGAVIFGALDTAISGTYPVEGMRLGLSRSEALHVVGLMALGLVFSQFPCGWLADKFGSRRLLAVIGTLGLASCIAAGFASQMVAQGNKTWVAAAYVGIGMAVGGSYPISLKILGDRTPPEKLPIANARFSTIYGYASLSAPIVAAFGIDMVETLGYLGWAVPGLSGLTLAALLLLVMWDRRVVGNIALK
jgi:MFS family permease